MKISLATRVFFGIIIIILIYNFLSIFGILKLREINNEFSFYIKNLIPLRFQLKKLIDDSELLFSFVTKKDYHESKLIIEFMNQRNPFRRLNKIISEVWENKKFWNSKSFKKNFFNNIYNQLIIIRDGVNFSEIVTTEDREKLKEFINQKNDELFSSILLDYLRTIQTNQKIEQTYQKYLTLFLINFKKNIRKMEIEIDQFSQKLISYLDKNELWLYRILLIITLIAIIISILILFHVLYSLKPIKGLISAIKIVANGKYNEGLIESHGKNEISELGEEFNKMVLTLKKRDEQLRDQQEKLMRAERLAIIGKMASFIAHEIRNPLSSIALNAEYLEDELENKRHKECVQNIIIEVNRLKEITEQYLTFARLPNPEYEVYSIKTGIIQYIKFAFEKDLEKHKIKLIINEFEDINVEMDLHQIRQAFFNIIKNAIEAVINRENPVIDINFKIENNWLIVDIEDNGEGISELYLNKIFEPFFSMKKSGSGLGLAITKEIIEKHNGYIYVKSKPKVGTTVTVKLPIKR